MNMNSVKYFIIESCYLALICIIYILSLLSLPFSKLNEIKVWLIIKALALAVKLDKAE